MKIGQSRLSLTLAHQMTRWPGLTRTFEASANLAAAVLPRTLWQPWQTRATVNSLAAIEVLKNSPAKNSAPVPFKINLSRPEYSLEVIAQQFDAFWLDFSGVVTSKQKVFPWAIEALKNLSSQGKKIFLLSNTADHLPEYLVNRIRPAGFEVPVDTVITSGSALTEVVKKGEKVFLVGKAESHPYIEQCGGQLFSEGESGLPDRIVIAYFFEADQESVAQLKRAVEYAQRGVGVVLANPDYTFPAGDENHTLISGTGKAADYLKDAGIPYTIVGKPSRLIFQKVYQKMIEKGQSVSRKKILMVGDSVEYDILGAANFGIASLLILTGNHTHTPAAEFSNLFRCFAPPTYVLNRFSW